MGSILTAEISGSGNGRVRIFRKVIIKTYGLQAYIDSYEKHLQKQWLAEYEIKQELNRVCWEAIYSMQKNYQYN